MEVQFLCVNIKKGLHITFFYLNAFSVVVIFGGYRLSKRTLGWGFQLGLE